MGIINKPTFDVVTLTRASSATRTNSLGVIESVAANVPRIDYDPVTLSVIGILVEEQRTNLLLNSLIDGTPLASQSVVVTAVPHTLSFYGSGSVALSGAYTGNLVGAGAYPTRGKLTFTPAAGTLNITVTGDVKFGQLEPNNSVSSFIPTSGSQSTRAGDVPSINTNSAWFPKNGTLVYAEFLRKNIPATEPINRSIFRMTGVSTDSRIDGLVGGGNPLLHRVECWVGGAVQSSLQAGANYVEGSVARMAFCYRQDDFVATYSGGAALIDLAGQIPSAISVLQLGNSSGSSQLNGHLRKFRIYPKRPSNDDIVYLTTYGRLPGEGV